MSFSEQDHQEFNVEAFELLDVAEKSLLAIHCETYKNTFDAVFRSFHNLKGAAGMMELTALQSHMHELETSLMKFKEGPSIPTDVITYFLRGIDTARSFH